MCTAKLKEKNRPIVILDARLCSQPNTYKCNGTLNCVLEPWLHDAEDDCGDKSDESTVGYEKTAHPLLGHHLQQQTWTNGKIWGLSSTKI